EATELGNAFYLKLPKDVPGNAPLFGARFTYWPVTNWALEGETRYALSSLRSTGDSAPVLGFRGYLRYDLGTAGSLQPFFRLGAGGEYLTKTVLGAEADVDSSFLLGAGLHIPVNDFLNFRLDAVYYSTRGTPDMALAHNAELQLGIGFRVYNGTDTDGDGIADSSDKCPTEAEDKDGFEDEDGCPDLDNDADGLADATDKCPTEAEDKDGFEDWDGCPDTDNDKDGIADGADKCPNKAENINKYQDDDGCPDDPDADGDGIVDSKDKCPKEPETKNGFKDEDGCPDIGDADHDGVGDDKDKCPDKPETKNGYQDDDGCPDTVPAKIAKMFSGTIKGIEFETGSAKILPKSFKTLDAAVAILKEFPALKVEISGHTDNTGAEDFNKKLSQDRADSVKAYMTEKGIGVERLLAIGYGQDKPIADNKSKTGKQKNRRIEFHLQPQTDE
ncbi:MAG: OmpA family protein, partial [Deltaproteobacteria bacterium]|nr:OmpA family protein [Deltaproteobacteria bacterium]